MIWGQIYPDHKSLSQFQLCWMNMNIVNDIWTCPKGFFSGLMLFNVWAKVLMKTFFPQISLHPLLQSFWAIFSPADGDKCLYLLGIKSQALPARGPDPSATLPFTVRETDGADSRCVFEEAVLDLVRFVVPLTGWFSAQPLIEQ